MPVSNVLDPDQAIQNIVPDPGRNCLQRTAAAETICCFQGKYLI